MSSLIRSPSWVDSTAPHPTLGRVANGGRIPRSSLLTALAVGLAGGLAAARLTTYAIAERSMEPELRPGDWVIAVKRPRRLQPGDVVVVEHPGRPGFDLVKRVAGLPGDPLPDGGSVPEGTVWLLGDNPDAGSVDSRTLGPLPEGLVHARVVARYHPRPPRRIERPVGARSQRLGG